MIAAKPYPAAAMGRTPNKRRKPPKPRRKPRGPPAKPVQAKPKKRS